jgi:hypothetical protein
MVDLAAGARTGGRCRGTRRATRAGCPAFVAHVRDVHPAVPRRDFGQRHQLARRSEDRRGVGQRGADAERTLRASPGRPVRLHAGELGRRGRAVRRSRPRGRERSSPRRTTRRWVETPCLLEVLEVTAERRPGHLEASGRSVRRGGARASAGGERSHRRAFAEDLEGDSLVDIGERAAVDEQRLVGPGEHVDEARRNGASADVELDAPARAKRAPAGGNGLDSRDPVAVDRQVADVGGAAAAVVDRSATEDDVVDGRTRNLRRRLRWCRRRRLPRRAARGMHGRSPCLGTFNSLSGSPVFPLEGYRRRACRLIRPSSLRRRQAREDEAEMKLQLLDWIVVLGFLAGSWRSAWRCRGAPGRAPASSSSRVARCPGGSSASRWWRRPSRPIRRIWSPTSSGPAASRGTGSGGPSCSLAW